MLNLTSSAIDENLLLFSSKFLQQKEYWINKLTVDIEETVTGFETDIDMNNDFKPGCVNIEIPDALSQKLLNFCNRTDATIYIVLLAVLKILIYRYTNNKDITVISPLFRDNETDETINDFLYIRDVIGGDITGKSLLHSISHSVLEAYEYQDYPVDKIKQYLFNTAQQQTARSISGIVCSLANIHDETAIDKIEGAIYFRFNRLNDKIDGKISYDAGIHEERNVLKVPGHFIRVLENLTRSADIRLSEIPVISPQEKEELIYHFNDNTADFSKDRSICQLVQIRAEIEPDVIAIVFTDHRVTYGCLDKRSGQLALLLRQNGVDNGQPVGIILERSPLMVESIIGIWKANGAYLPIDPGCPQERIDYMLKDSGAQLLVTTNEKEGEKVRRWEGEKKLEIIFLDSLSSSSFLTSNLPNFLTSHPFSLAYLIYTSGSTGRPKGVMIEHIGMMNHIQAKINDLELTKESVVAQNSSHTFDISVWQFFAALAVGGKVVIYPSGIILDPHRFLTGLEKNQVTVLEVVPSYLLLMLDTLTEKDHPLPLHRLKYILVTGEMVVPDLVKQWFLNYPGIPMINAYGPTEASDDITHHIMNEAPQMQRVPIGKPVQNLDIYIVDENMNLCPVGVKGEICVSGVGVGRGYLNNPEFTRQKFLWGVQGGGFFKKSPPGRRGQRLFKTGDLGRWLPGGVIEFFGRKDRQVKIRGFRIELGEIENELTNHNCVRGAVVVVREDKQKNKYLCAYLTAKTGEKIEIPDIKEYLRARLPQYMVPAYLVQLPDIPTTPNGKVDIKALPISPMEMESEFVEPRDEVEKQLAEVWSEVLGIEKKAIGLESNFFELGGHSLKATILVSKIHKVFDVKVPLVEIFKIHTLKGMAEYIAGKEKDSCRFQDIQPVEEKEYYPVSSAQKRMFLLNRIKGIHTTSDTTPGVLVVEGKLDYEYLQDVVKQLIKRHESLRTSFEIRDEQIIQWVHRDVDFRIHLMEAKEEEIDEVIKTTIRPFDLGKAPLLRVELVRLSQEKHLLIYNMHHIITDGTSMGIFIRDFIHLYKGLKLRTPQLKYRDFAIWQSHQLQLPFIKKQEEYWLSVFPNKETIPVLAMPTDFPRPPVQIFEGNYMDFKLSLELTALLRKLITRSGATLYMVLMAIYNILLSKYTAQEDIVMGIPIQGRNHPDLENLLGFFVNTLAIRSFPAGDKIFMDFLDEVKEKSLKAYENQDFQFEELVARLGIQPDPGRQALFSTMFEHSNMNQPDVTGYEDQSIGHAVLKIGDLNFKQYEFKNNIIQFDLLLHAFDANDIIEFRLLYSTNLFKKETIKRFTSHLINITSEVVSNPYVKISDIQMFSQEETGKITALSTREIIDNLEIDLEF